MDSRGGASIKKSENPRTCLCSPSIHPGSFRCSRHKKPPRAVARSRPRPRSRPVPLPVPGTPSPNPRHHHWDSSMAAKAHSLNAILLQMIRPPSTHDHHRRKSFQPKPTRFYLMNGNSAAVAVN